MFGNLADGFNLMIARFGQLLKQVREAADREQVGRYAPRLRRTDVRNGLRRRKNPPRTLGAVEQLAAGMRRVASTAGASSDSAEASVVGDGTRKRGGAGNRARHYAKYPFGGCNACPKQVKGLGDRSSKFHKSCRPFGISPTRRTCSRSNAAIEAAWAPVRRCAIRRRRRPGQKAGGKFHAGDP